MVVRDTASYADFQWPSPEAVLSQLRTPGYLRGSQIDDVGVVLTTNALVLVRRMGLDV